MKHLIAFLVALFLVVIPVVASADNVIVLWAIPYGPNYPEGHHYNVNIDMPGGGVPPWDAVTYQAAAIAGNFDQYAQQNRTGLGIYVTGSGIWAYMVNHSGVSKCPSPSFSYFSGTACLQLIPGLTLGDDVEAKVELDFYPAPTNKWIGWVQDEQNVWHDIGEFNTTSDWFTNVAFETLIDWQGSNPGYNMDAHWKHPNTWNGSWTPYTTMWAQYYDSTGANTCYSQYAFIKEALMWHSWDAGSTFGDPLNSLCVGYLWVS